MVSHLAKLTWQIQITGCQLNNENHADQHLTFNETNLLYHSPAYSALCSSNVKQNRWENVQMKG